MTKKKEDRSTWAIGAGTLIGLGVGFFYLQYNTLYFVGCIILGIGVGLLISSLIPPSSKDDSSS